MKQTRGRVRCKSTLSGVSAFQREVLKKKRVISKTPSPPSSVHTSYITIDERPPPFNRVSKAISFDILRVGKFCYDKLHLYKLSRVWSSTKATPSSPVHDSCPVVLDNNCILINLPRRQRDAPL